MESEETPAKAGVSSCQPSIRLRISAARQASVNGILALVTASVSTCTVRARLDYQAIADAQRCQIVGLGMDDHC
jgi:hypothetical protein